MEEIGDIGEKEEQKVVTRSHLITKIQTKTKLTSKTKRILIQTPPITKETTANLQKNL